MNTNNPGAPVGGGSQEREAEAAAAAAAVASSGAHAAEAASSVPPEEREEGAEAASSVEGEGEKSESGGELGAGASSGTADTERAGAGAPSGTAETERARAARREGDAGSLPNEPAAEIAELEQADTRAHNHGLHPGLHHNHRHRHDLNPTLEEQAEPSPLAALNHVISANFRRAVLALIMACAGLGLTYVSGGVLPAAGTERPVQFFQTHQGLAQTLAILGAVIFFVFGVSAVRSATKEILKTVPPSIGDNRKNGLRWVCRSSAIS
jgi:hypothetical protein